MLTINLIIFISVANNDDESGWTWKGKTVENQKILLHIFSHGLLKFQFRWLRLIVDHSYIKIQNQQNIHQCTQDCSSVIERERESEEK